MNRGETGHWPRLRGKEKERPIVRSMREEIGDSISTQMSRGQIFPGSGPWRLGSPWGWGIGCWIKSERDRRLKGTDRRIERAERGISVDGRRVKTSNAGERRKERAAAGLYPNWRGSWPIARSRALCLGGWKSVGGDGSRRFTP